jgi:hypothetical protein
MSTKYESRATSWAVLPKGEPLFSELATVISIDYEAVGEFVTVEQRLMPESSKVAISHEEWPAIRAAIDHAISECRAYKDDEVGA